MKKLFLILLLGIVLIASVSATLPDVPQFECVQLRTISNSSTVTLSSVTYPNETTISIDTAMTQNGRTFNYTFCNTFEIGNYVYDYYDAEGEVFVNDFNVTPDGFGSNAWFYILLFAIAFGILVFGYKFEDYWVVIFGAFVLILIGLYVLFYGIIGMKDPVYTWGVGIITLMLGAYFGIRASLEQLF